MRRSIGRIAPALALAAAACGSGDEPGNSASDLPADELYNRIDAARRPPPEEAEPVRLGVITAAEVPAELRGGRACTLVRDGRLLLHVAAGGAIARIDGRLLRLAIAGPVGPTGGFFQAPGVTLSVGRQVAPLARGAEPAAPASASIGNGRDAEVQRVEGVWQCGGPAGPAPAGPAPPAAN